MSDGPAVTKTVWTDADFPSMGWHDNAVHAGGSSAAVVAGQALA